MVGNLSSNEHHPFGGYLRDLRGWSSICNQFGLTSQIVDRIKTKPQGLLVIIGGAASGKTATALSILEWLNQNRHAHILTVEDPIEYALIEKNCTITQREARIDVASFADGLRGATLLSPNAILATEDRDRNSAVAAITGGESDSLMIVTTHGNSVTGALRKLLYYTGTPLQCHMRIHGRLPHRLSAP